jgi:hypothetical protein
MEQKRNDNDLPTCTAEWGWKYHHLGVPTTVTMPCEVYLEQFKFYVSGFDKSPFGIEWMRFEPGSPIHPLIQSVPHLAFAVDDVDREIAAHNLNVLTPPNSPSSGVRVAMIEHNGAPIELIEFS